MDVRNPFLSREREEYRLAEKLRAQRGLTQKEVAKIAGIDESTVRNYELARRTPKPEHLRGLATALEVMPEALATFNGLASLNELFLMTVELADAYGFEFGYDEECAYFVPVREFFVEGVRRWAKAYEAMCANENTFRDDYELWKDVFHDHFSKADFPDVYPEYDPMRPDSEQRWVSRRFAEALKEIRLICGLTQEELADRAGIGLFTLRSYEQGKRLPRAKQIESLCGALRITDAALARHYFGSPNQAMHYLFAIAKTASLTPENDVDVGPRLRTQDNMMGRGFVCLADKIDELKADPTAARQEDFSFRIATFDLMGEETDRAFKQSGRRQVNVTAELPPRA